MRGRREILAVLLGLALLGPVAARQGNPTAEREVPIVVGETFVEAQRSLERSGFDGVLGTVRHRQPAVDGCKVERQRPAPFSVADPGRVTVDLDCRFDEIRP